MKSTLFIDKLNKIFENNSNERCEAISELVKQILEFDKDVINYHSLEDIKKNYTGFQKDFINALKDLITNPKKITSINYELVEEYVDKYENLSSEYLNTESKLGNILHILSFKIQLKYQNDSITKIKQPSFANSLPNTIYQKLNNITIASLAEYFTFIKENGSEAFNLEEDELREIADNFFGHIAKQRGLIAFYSNDRDYKNFGTLFSKQGERLVDPLSNMYMDGKWEAWFELTDYTITHEMSKPNSNMILNIDPLDMDKMNGIGALKPRYYGVLDNHSFGILHHPLDYLDGKTQTHAAAYYFIHKKYTFHKFDPVSYICMHKEYSPDTKMIYMTRIFALITSSKNPENDCLQLFIDINQESIVRRGGASEGENIIQALSIVFNSIWRNDENFPEDQQALSFYFIENKKPIEENHDWDQGANFPNLRDEKSGDEDSYDCHNPSDVEPMGGN